MTYERVDRKLLSDNIIRCPHCGETRPVGDELYAEGCHDVYCHECDREFDVYTFVNHTFQSPERISK